MLKGLSLSVEGHGQDGRGTKIVYRFSVMSWREEDRRASSSCLERGDKRKGGKITPTGGRRKNTRDDDMH